MNKTGSKILHGMLLATSALVGSSVIVSTAAMANPTGGTVAVGSATITNPNSSKTVITQSTNKALINWNTFNVGSDQTVQFVQPGTKSLTVNRVTGPGSSTIDGNIIANGNVWLLNANGILFGKGSQVNVGSLMATTSELSDADFRAGNNNFTASPNPDASVVNQGTITAGQGGSVVLSAPRVSNEGLIQADLGTVVLGGAQAFTVDMTGDNLLRYQITAPVTKAPKDGSGNVASALVSNSGTIAANGGHVLMTARAARNVEDNVINNTGMVEATSVSSHDGEIDFDAGPDGTANVGGTVDASGLASGQTGGTVNVTGGTVVVADGAKINASGDAGGGTINIGGGLHGGGALAHAKRTFIGAATITADATNNGNGGTVAVWSDGKTAVNGTISAQGGANGGNGGQVETSGHQLGVSSNATVTTAAKDGLVGDWLLDPNEINVVSGGQNTYSGPNSTFANTTSLSIDPSAIVSALSNGGVTLQANDAITVTNAITAPVANGTLEMDAGNSITINAAINVGTRQLILSAGDPGASGAFTGAGVIIDASDSLLTAGTITLKDGKTGVAGDVIGSAAHAINVATGNLSVVAAGDNIFVNATGNVVIGDGANGISGKDITLTASGNITQTSVISATGITSIATTGTSHNIVLTNAANDFGTAGVLLNTAGNASLSAGTNTVLGVHEDPDDVPPNFVVGGNLTVVSGGSLTLAGRIHANGTGDTTLQAFNDIDNDANGDGTIIADNLNLISTCGTIGAGSFSFKISAPGSDTLNLHASAQNGSINLFSTNSGILNIGTDQGGLNASGEILIAGNSAVTQLAGNNGAITAGTLNASSSGPITLTNVANDVQGGVSFATTGAIKFTNDDDTTIQIINGGDSSTSAGKVTIRVIDGTLTQGEGGSIFSTGLTASTEDSTCETECTSPTEYDMILANANNVSGTVNLSGTGVGQFLNTRDTKLGVVDFHKSFDIETTDGNEASGQHASITIGSVLEGGTGVSQLFAQGNITDTAGTYLDANSVNLESIHGSIGTASKPVDISVFHLSAETTNANVFLNSDQTVTVGTVDGGLSTGTGDLTLTAHGTLNIGEGVFLAIGGNTSLVTTGDLNIASSIQTQGAGNITLVAGWDGTTAVSSIATTPSAYGVDGAGDINLSGAESGVAIGSKTGTTTLLANDVTLDSTFGDIQLGYSKTSGATGNIKILAKGDLTFESGEGGDLAMIGNGGIEGDGNVSGNIFLKVGGFTDIDDGNGNFWLGNRAVDSGAKETGNVTLITNGATLNGDFLADDLGTGAGTGGNVFVGFTGTSGTYHVGGVNIDNSVHSFTWAAAANLDVNGNVTNSGTGDINLIAGWDGHTTNLASLTNASVFGNNNGAVTLNGGEAGIISVGSKKGTTTVEAHDIYITAIFGSHAQIGYDGAGATGAINILADGAVNLTGGEGGYAQIGNGGTDVGSLVGGNISIVTSGGGVTLLSNSDDSIVEIGNLGGAGASEIGNISINTHGGAVAVNSEGGDNEISGDTSFAQIGNWTDGSSTGGSSGDILIKAGAVSVLANGVIASADIGNGNYLGAGGKGDIGGNITINATSLAVTADTSEGAFEEARVGNLGVSNVTGNLLVTTTGDVTVQAIESGAASIGNFSNPNNFDGTTTHETQGLSTANVTVNAGGDISVSASGNSSAYASIENGGALSGAVNVTATGDITLSASDGAGALIGTLVYGNGGNDISVKSTTGKIEVDATGAGSNVQIGNEAATASSQYTVPVGAVTGNVTVVAANAVHGKIIVSASDDATDTAKIGNSGLTGGTVAGNLSIKAGNVFQDSNPALTTIGNTGGTETGNVMILAGRLVGDISADMSRDLDGGNFTLGITNASAATTLSGVSYDSDNTLRILAAGDLTIAGTIENKGGGNITLVSGWDTSVAPANVTSTNGLVAGGTHTLTIGGANASGNAAVGSALGTIRVFADNVVVDSEHGFAQLGYHGIGSGAVVVDALRNVTVESGLSHDFALIGDGGFEFAGAIGGKITVTAGKDISVLADASSSIANIGNFGGDGSTESGKINVSAGGQLSLVADKTRADAQIGNQEVDTATPVNFGSASGDIDVSAGSIVITAGGSQTAAQIGNGNPQVFNGNVTGDITIATGDLALSSAGTASSGSVARIGDTANGVADTDILINASGDVTLSAGESGHALIGQDSQTGAAAGNISLTSDGAISLGAASGGHVLIGNVATGAASGNVVVVGSSIKGIEASIVHDMPGGDFKLHQTGTGALTLDQSILYKSGHTLTVVSGGKIDVGASLENTGTGDITLTSPGEITVGGAGATGGVSVGSKSGKTTLNAGDLLLAATHGYAQVGYHGGGSGAILVNATGDVTLNGGSNAAYFAQIGDGGYKVTGSNTGAVSVLASGNVTLHAGAGSETYAQIGNGGAESNSNTSGYTDTGAITVKGRNVKLGAGGGAGSYAQIGDGGYKSGQSLDGKATVGGNVVIDAVNAVTLTGNGTDAYAQIGNGGGFINYHAANGSNGTIGGDITVDISNPIPAGNAISMLSGSGANAYVQIGNGGVDENKPASGANVSFVTGGDINIADLVVMGSDSGTNGYGQIGNGDASQTGTADINGNITFISGTSFTLTDGKATGANASIGNATGTGTVTGTITGYTPPGSAPPITDPSTIGSIDTTIQNPTTPTDVAFVEPTVIPDVINLPSDFGTGPSNEPTPLQKLAGDGGEGDLASDAVAHSVGSLDGKSGVTTKTLIPGVLSQIVTLTPRNPHGVPPADEDYSSWGNESLWRW